MVLFSCELSIPPHAQLVHDFCVFTISVCSAHRGAIFALIGHAFGDVAATGDRSDGPVLVYSTDDRASVRKPHAGGERRCKQTKPTISERSRGQSSTFRDGTACLHDEGTDSTVKERVDCRAVCFKSHASAVKPPWSKGPRVCI